MSQILTVGSLFSGIGGLDLGLERTGRFQIAWQVEINEYCQQVLAKHWPNTPRYGDVRRIGVDNLSSVNLLCGGFPCQDISISNTYKPQGIQGPRSGLWSEFSRLIRELRPQYVLVENVSKLLDRGMGQVLADLASCGYDAEWQCVPAAAVGAPHVRDRIFILAYPSSFQWQQILRTPNCQQGSSNAMGWTKKKRCTSWESFELAPRYCLAGLWSPQSRVQRVSDGVPHRMDRLKCLGNAVVPQVAEYIGYCIATWHDNHSMFDKPS
ncbi:DNA cytosine methyltransferase [Dictyobacter aurantiacus]|uniref:DNA cytosine methyltransferase n=1 Tax=Dictyobacter aurantiacus TaxID=1936993 RepID=UPI000F82DB86